MTIIDMAEEFARDRDWYACDQEGCTGHFATADLRALPPAVKRDREAAEGMLTADLRCVHAMQRSR